VPPLYVVQKNVIWRAAKPLTEFEEVPQARAAATLLEQPNGGGFESTAFGKFRLGDAAHFPQRGEASGYHEIEVVSKEDHRCIGVSKMHNKSCEATARSRLVEAERHQAAPPYWRSPENNIHHDELRCQIPLYRLFWCAGRMHEAGRT
jgi:hypothetical protein